MDKIKTFLESITTPTAPYNPPFPVWQQQAATPAATKEVKIYKRPTLIGAFIPFIDELVLLFTEPMIQEAEELFRRNLIEFITLPKISAYLGKRNSNKLANFLETGRGAPPMEPIQKIMTYLFDTPIEVEIEGSETTTNGRRIVLTKTRDGWQTEVKNDNNS